VEETDTVEVVVVVVVVGVNKEEAGALVPLDVDERVAQFAVAACC
jgi:hypothetical protein